MTPSQKLEEIRLACISSNPEIVELKFGCVIEVGKKKHQLTLKRSIEGGYCSQCREGRISGSAFTSYRCGYCKKGFSHSNTGTPRYCVMCAHKHGKCRWCATPLKIIGRAPRLADILLAIGRKCFTSIDHNAPTRFLIMNKDYSHPRAEWNLPQDDLNLQDTPTIDFIHSVLKP